MTLSERDYVRRSHPSDCSCSQCVRKRLSQWQEQNHSSSRRSSYAQGASIGYTPANRQQSHPTPTLPRWLMSTLLVAAFSFLGWGIATAVGSSMPFWLAFGASVAYVARNALLPTAFFMGLALAIASTVSMAWPEGVVQVVPKPLEILHILPTNVDVEQVEDAVFQLINEERTSRGLAPLQEDTSLSQYARQHSADMATRGNLYHDTAQLTVLQAGENALSISKYAGGFVLLPYPIGLAFYHTDRELCKEAVRSWMNSSGHRQNILTAQYRYAGIGVSVAVDGITCYMSQEFR